MRCQWGTRWDNMQPWLVARRFREFDALNEMVRRGSPPCTAFVLMVHLSQLTKHFPRSKDKMFPLPKKLLFGSLDSETIDQRTRDIEEYMATIITDIPAVRVIPSQYLVLARI